MHWLFNFFLVWVIAVLSSSNTQEMGEDIFSQNLRQADDLMEETGDSLRSLLDEINKRADLTDLQKAKMYLTEAYRQKQEHNKGIGNIYEILRHPNNSLANRAFAFNRMAALQNENLHFEGNLADLVREYSRLCIDISQKHTLIYVESGKCIPWLYLCTHCPQKQAVETYCRLPK